MTWGFDIKGVEGENVDTMDYNGGSLVHPPKSGVAFKVRSKKHREVLEREAEEPRVFMKDFEKFD